MARRETDSPNWGGKRKGAGRPNEIGSRSEQLSVRLDAETAELCKANGGAAFMREAIKAALERLNKPSTATESVPHSRAIAGFRSVRRESFAFLHADEKAEAIPLVDMQVACGSPIPAQDPDANSTCLSDLMIRHPETTFMAEATGDSMIDAGIYEGDTVIFDRGIPARNGDIVLAYLHGDMTLKRLRIVNGKPELHPENEAAGYPVIRPTEYDDFQIQGVLTGICRRYR